jgi:hypothetical protein
MENSENVEAAVNSDLNSQDSEAVEQISQQFMYSVEDIEKARAQEKDKLYPVVEKMKEELSQLKRERDEQAAKEAERLAQRREREKEIAKKKKEEEEEELSLKDLLKKKEEELLGQIEQERSAREQALALLDRERQYQELMAYRQNRLEQERENIIPELIDLIQGDSTDAIEQSIANLKEKSARIFDSVATASQQTRKEMVGARITVPASGPLDTDMDSYTSTPDDVRNMSMADYAKNRAKLLNSSDKNRGQGLFG